MEPVIAERRIRGDGTPESAWQAWPALAEMSRRPVDRWLPGQGRVVVVAPHPDDEVLGCGALLCLHAARGGASLVVAVTDGEASHGASSLWPPERLAAARRAESAVGLRLLGVKPGAVVRLGLPDGRVAAHIDTLTRALTRCLRPGDTVVSTWRLDGHPDHDATGEAAAKACEVIGCRLLQVPVWMWHWAEPGDARVPWQRMRGLHVPLPVLLQKQRALAAHATQCVPRDGGQGPVLNAAILQRAARDTEYFFV